MVRRRSSSPARTKMHPSQSPAHDTPVYRLMLGVSTVLAVFLAFMIYRVPGQMQCPDSTPLNRTYPLSPVEQMAPSVRRFRLAVITDRDEESKSTTDKNTWVAFMRYAYFTYDYERRTVDVKWDKETVELKSTLSQGGRAMELSDLKVFNGQLFSIDDRTGVVYRFTSPTKAIPWVVMPDGDGSVAKGFKAEWMTVKDDHLYVGGLGKEWTTTAGEFVNHNPMYVKRISADGSVEHVRWVDQYKKVRAAAGINYPGYMIHEACQWSDILRRWVFLPRRASDRMYTEAADERRGTNFMITADETFTDVRVTKVTPLTNTRGFSAFQFVPGTEDSVIVALKSEEDGGTTNSYMTVFTTEGKVLMAETQLEGHYKFEGVEFV